ncbi:MAG: helix-turn-helix domain-containing protein [Bacteroidota bacterium]
MINHFKPEYPVSPALKDHIYCYYFYESDDENYTNIHYSFPHIYNALSIYSTANVELSSQFLKAMGNKWAPASCVLQGKRPSPLKVELTGKLKRVTIIFKPLGLNHFIRCPLSKVMGKDPSHFTLWQGDVFDQLVQSIFNVTVPSGQLSHLEEFLTKIYQPVELNKLEMALLLLDDHHNKRTIEEIAACVGLPLRSFNRLFRLHLGISPVTHQRISRFRQSLENKFFQEKMKKLTDISFQSGFYDQSDFIKLYRQLGGINPQALFNNVQQIGDTNLVFQFLKY